MDNTIKDFEDARAELSRVEDRLNAIVQDKMTPLINNCDVDGLQDLLDELPLKYNGRRRIYQAILEVEDGSTYKVTGNHPILARPDKFNLKLMDANNLVDELLRLGYENIKMEKVNA